MSEAGDRLNKLAEKRLEEENQDRKIHSLLVELTKSGKIEWERCRFGIYPFVAKSGAYTFKLLSSNRSSRKTIYVSTKDAERDLHVDGSEIWFYLTGKSERPSRENLIRYLLSKGARYE